MKTETTRETDATSPGAARRTARGFALKAPGHHIPAMAQRRPGGSIEAVFGPGAAPIQARRETAPVEASLQHGADSASSPALRGPLGAGPSRAAPRTSGTGLPDRLKAGVEALSGLSMDDVRVHYNSPRPAQLQALAFTQGADIHVGPGHETHLPHEAWHVVQQKQGRVQATLQTRGVPINDDHALEREADRIGARAAQPGALALSPGCGCALCANNSGVQGGGAHRIVPASASNRIGQRLIIQRVKVECPSCSWRVQAGSATRCPQCNTALPVKAASAAPSKSEGAAAKATKAVAAKGKSAEAKKAPTHTIRIQLQLVNPEVELSEVVHHYDGTPITEEEAIDALDALLSKAEQAGVAKAKLKSARKIAPEVRKKIRQGAIAQSASTYLTKPADKNRIDVENVRGDRNFTPNVVPAAAAAGAAAPAAAAGAGAGAPAPAAAPAPAGPAAAGAPAPAAVPAGRRRRR